jgi:hypothetical protein
MLVPRRDTVSIKKQIRATVTAAEAAEKARSQAETMRLGATSRIEFKKVEIVRIKDRISCSSLFGVPAGSVHRSAGLAGPAWTR